MQQRNTSVARDFYKLLKIFCTEKHLYFKYGFYFNLCLECFAKRIIIVPSNTLLEKTFVHVKDSRAIYW